MHFFDQAAERRIHVLYLLRPNWVHQLVRVMVHLIAALRANHFILLHRISFLHARVIYPHPSLSQRTRVKMRIILSPSGERVKARELAVSSFHDA